MEWLANSPDFNTIERVQPSRDDKAIARCNLAKLRWHAKCHWNQLPQETTIHHRGGRAPCSHGDNTQPPRPLRLHHRHLRGPASCSRHFIEILWGNFGLGKTTFFLFFFLFLPGGRKKGPYQGPGPPAPKNVLRNSQKSPFLSS
jgi:hypothetical protein